MSEPNGKFFRDATHIAILALMVITAALIMVVVVLADIARSLKVLASL